MPGTHHKTRLRFNEAIWSPTDSVLIVHAFDRLDRPISEVLNSEDLGYWIELEEDNGKTHRHVVYIQPVFWSVYQTDANSLN